MSTVTLPALRRTSGIVQRQLRTKPLRLPSWLDGWLASVALLGIILSVTVCIFAYHNHTILLYSDAYSHLTIARRVVDNPTPGLAQLGGVWLPLPHLIMMPLVWHMGLWASGLGGAIPSMLCYVISACYLFLAARRITRNATASFIGTFVFLINPNVLYVQSTPLTEPIMIATMTATSYYFLAWAQEDSQNYLMLAGLCTFLATLARYDGWPLFLVILVLIALIGWQKRQSRSQVTGNLLLYGTIGGLGIVLWFVWNLIIFANPLFFLNGPYSSAVMQAPLIKSGLVETYHNIFQSIRYYSVISAETLGPVIFALGVIGVLVYVARRRLTPEVMASLVFLVPFAFYIVSLFSGQAIEYAPHAVPAQVSTIFYNVRYGTQVVAPAAFFIAILASMVHLWLRPVLVGVVAVQSLLTATGGIISLQDGLYGASCSPYRTTTNFLAQHYDNGTILEDTYFQNPQDFAFTVGIDLKSIVYQGSGALWTEALDNPATNVHWVYARTGDLVTKHIDVQSSTFLSQFTLVARDSDGATLYHLSSVPLAQHTVTPDQLALHLSCTKQANP